MSPLLNEYAAKERTPESDITGSEEDGWQRELKRTTEVMKRRGMDVWEVDADGNCLFRAASKLLGLDENDHMNVRGRCLRWMRSHPEDFAPFLPDDPDSPEDDPDDDKIYRYTTMMNKQGAWGGDLEIKALAHVYKTRFLVHQADKADPLEFGDVTQKDGECAQLIFYPTHHAGAHYNIGYFSDHPEDSLPSYEQVKNYLYESSKKEKERIIAEAAAEEKRAHESRFIALAGAKKLAAPKAKKKKKSAFG